MSASGLEHSKKTALHDGDGTSLEQFSIARNGAMSDKREGALTNNFNSALDDANEGVKYAIVENPANDYLCASQNTTRAKRAPNSSVMDPNGLECSTTLDFRISPRISPRSSARHAQEQDQSNMLNWSLDGCPNDQHIPSTTIANGRPGDHHNAIWRADMDSTKFLRYHKESNERDKMLEKDYAQREASMRSQPSNPNGQYQLALSQSTSATSIGCPHSIVQTSFLNNNIHSLPVCNFPNQSLPTSSSCLNASHVLTSQSDPLQRANAQINFNNDKPNQPVDANVPNNPKFRQLTSSKQSVGFASPNQSFSVPWQTMAHNTRNKTFATKKRLRSKDLSDNLSPVNFETTDLECDPNPRKMAFTQEDDNYITALIDAMNDMSASEDNDGMIKSWDKIRIVKAERVNTVCEELLVTMKRADALNDQPLCDQKRSSNKYATFEDRFNAICKTLKTQKTVCKHLLEYPYLHQVVDDPIYASMRVANNRRVNRGKKAAIEQGRKILGLKGAGKGHPLVKENYSDVDDADEDSEDQDGSPTVEPHFERRIHPFRTNLRDRSLLKKPSYLIQSVEHVQESDEDDEISRPTKKPKVKDRSALQNDDSMDTRAGFLGNETQHVGSIKVKDESRFPFNFLTVPLNSMKASEPPPIESVSNHYGHQGDTVYPVASFHGLYCDNSSLGYYPSAYQQYFQPAYPTMQPHGQYQLPYHHNMDYPGHNVRTTFVESSPNVDPYTSDPVTDETDVPMGFCNSDWYNNYLKQTPRP